MWNKCSPTRVCVTYVLPSNRQYRTLAGWVLRGVRQGAPILARCTLHRKSMTLAYRPFCNTTRDGQCAFDACSASSYLRTSAYVRLRAAKSRENTDGAPHQCLSSSFTYCISVQRKCPWEIHHLREQRVASIPLIPLHVTSSHRRHCGWTRQHKFEESRLE